MTPAQMTNMRMPGGNMMNVPGANGLMSGAGGGMMGPPVLPRTQSGQPQLPGGGAEMGVPVINGMPNPQMPGIARQSSVGPSPAGMTNAAGLSINTNINQGMNAQMQRVSTPGHPAMAVPTPTASGSPNPAMLVDPTALPVAPATPRQASQPPTSGSPFPAGSMMGNVERKTGGPGLLVGAQPLSRVPTTDGFTAPAAAATATTTTTTSAVASANAPSAPPQGPAQIIPQLPPLPTNVSLNPKVTRVSVVPLVDSETTIRMLKTEEIEEVKGWMKIDKEYEARYKKMQERMTEEVRECIVKRRAWYEKDPLEDHRNVRRRKEKFDLIGLKTGKEEKIRKKVGKREGFKLLVVFFILPPAHR